MKTQTCFLRNIWLLPLLLLLALPAVVQALDYTFTTNHGAITITGYTGSGGAVSIPTNINSLPVTSIGDYALYGYNNLTSVTIGTNVTSIGSGAFGGCTNLSAITVDALNSVYSSVDGVLFDKSQTTLIQCPGAKLGSYTITNSVTSIEESAFDTCINLTNVTIPNSVTNIGSAAFYFCTSLTNVTIPDSVTYIGIVAFNGCASLSAITVDAPNSVYSTVDGVLFDKVTNTLIQCPGGKTGSYTVPNSVTSIESYAFSVCTSLTSVTIPDSVTNIGSVAFDGCTSLTSVTIGNSVTSIGEVAFGGCTSLTSITIPNSVTYIGYNAFYACSNLTGVYFQGNAPSLGSSVFYGATNATVYYLPETTGWYTPFGGRPAVLWKFNSTTNNGTITITGNTGPGGAMIIPSTINGLPVTSIGDSAFYYYTNLTGITIGNSVTGIDERAFSYCTSLTYVTIPNSVTGIGYWAFENCTSLTGVYFQGNAPSVGLYVFDGDNNATVYYLPGTTGWNPQVQTSGASFGVRTNRFGFTITGTSSLGVVVEACTNLANPIWSPVGTNSLTGGSSYFSDPQWTNYARRFYRLWGLTFAGFPVVLWNPQMQTSGASFGVRTNRFGFTITGSSNLVIVVEACTNLANPTWSPVGTNTLTDGSSYFSDAKWNYPGRYYRLRSP